MLSLTRWVFPVMSVSRRSMRSRRAIISLGGAGAGAGAQVVLAADAEMPVGREGSGLS